MKHLLFPFLLLFSGLSLAVPPDQKILPIGLAPSEIGRMFEAAEPMSEAPVGPIHSLAEWEASQAAITLWTNPSLVKAMGQRGALKLIADTRGDQSWWENWLRLNKISDKNVSYFTVPTNSIWIRDYGPWAILDGNAKFGWVHNTYNRPRPLDNQVAKYIAQVTHFPLYVTGLVHTGGNYYNDGLSNAFSSTLVFTENPSLDKNEILKRTLDFLGIERYTTSRLVPGLTIEHLDTYGKLVSPDTWVFSEFPTGTQYKADSDKYVALLKTLTSPYGTPYKIYRMPMSFRRDRAEFRAYLNSFISNGALYFPIYGDEIDGQAKAIYQKALPAYEIVGVDADGTSWGDSVHCRTRNLPAVDTIFIFPKVALKGRVVAVDAEVVPSPGESLSTAPVLHWKKAGVEQPTLAMQVTGERGYRIQLPSQETGTQLSLYIEAQDTAGLKKTAPIRAPEMLMEIVVK